MSAEASRREALTGAASTAGAIAAIGMIPAIVSPAPARGQASDDEDLGDFLEAALELEQAAVLAYGAAADEAKGELAGTFERFRDQEQAHANAFRVALDSLGFDLPDPPQAEEDSEALEGLDAAKSADDFLELLAGIERQQLAYYIEQAPELDSEDLARSSAEIAGNHAEQLVVLRQALGDTPAEAVEAAGDLGAGE